MGSAPIVQPAISLLDRSIGSAAHIDNRARSRANLGPWCTTLLADYNRRINVTMIEKSDYPGVIASARLATVFENVCAETNPSRVDLAEQSRSFRNVGGFYRLG